MGRFPKFLIAHNYNSFPDQDMIICTDKPYYAGMVMKFKQEWKADEFLSTSNHLVVVRVPGYHIYIYFFGSIDGRSANLTQDWEKEVQAVMREMAVFYLTDRTAHSSYMINKYRVRYEG
jgi:hypothetical protein